MYFFNKGFKASECKTLLKLTIPRIKLLRNRREIQLIQMRRDIAKLLEIGQEATARIRVEHIIREQKITAAQEIVELFCELIAVRLLIMEAQRECPLYLKEAVSSICFAAPRCPDLTELLQVQMMFAGKYGKEFVSAAIELRPECGVNRQLVELLSVRTPPPHVKLKLLKEIAEENGLDWDPSASESELLKPHGDLLFFSGPKSILQPTSTAPDSDAKQSDSDSEYEIVDYPEIPPHSMKGTPEMLPFPVSALSDSDDDGELTPHEKSLSKQDALLHEMPSHPVEASRFTGPPSQSSGAFPVKDSKMDSDLVVLAAAERSGQFKINELSSSPIEENPFFYHNSGAKEPAECYYDVYLEPGNASTHPNQSADGDFEISSPGNREDRTRHQPPSMDDDDVYFSYPNLFSNPGSLSSSSSEVVL